MNKKRILFFIYGVVVFIVIAIALVVFGVIENRGNDKNADGNKHTNENTSDKNIITKEEPQFAKKLTINGTRTVTIQKGVEVKILPNYVTVEPSVLFSNLTYKVYDAYGKETQKLNLVNNTLVPEFVGKYEIVYSIANSEDSYLTETIIVNVVAEDNENCVLLNKTNLDIGKTYNINELFTIPSFATNVVVISNNITIKNSIITPTAPGEEKITISYETNYLKFTFNYKIIIWPKETYTIKLKNIQGNTINKVCNVGDAFVLNYQIYYGEQEHINQSILVETDNSTLQYEITEPVIKVKCLKKGSAKLKIICNEDPSVYIELLINFI